MPLAHTLAYQMGLTYIDVSKSFINFTIKIENTHDCNEVLGFTVLSYQSLHPYNLIKNLK
jgi:hypothetical protein